MRVNVVFCQKYKLIFCVRQCKKYGGRSFMNTEDILHVAMEQSAEDINCHMGDFMKSENVVVPFRLGKNARKYLKEPIIADFVSYGNNVVASVSEDVRNIVTEYVNKYTFYHLFETPNMHWLDDRLVSYGYRICFMAEYYLPDLNKLRPLSCDYELRILGPQDFQNLYLPEWSNALCKDRRQLDVLGVGAYEGGKLVGLAGCSADCEEMWQIGVDVLPEYRRRGIACALTSRLAHEILERKKVPFYCSAWSNIRSMRNAIKSGFLPAWVEMTVKPDTIVSKINEP